MTKILIILGVLGAFILLAGCSAKKIEQPVPEGQLSDPGTTTGYQEINGDEMQELTKKGVRLIDVREPSEFQEGHLEGAELVPLGTVSEASKNWDKTKPLIMMCRSGNRSGQAAGFLKSEGFREVYNLAGGIMAWQGSIVKGNPKKK